MNKVMTKMRRLVIALTLMLTATVFLGTAAFATLALLDSKADIPSFGTVSHQSHHPANGTAKTRAPEPSTLALFGSGLVGMVISFIRRTYLLAKRIFDVMISVAAIILLSPVFLLIAILIKVVSRGPVFFTQTRVGKEGQLFKIYKFRTMRVDAEKESGPVWAAENDPRLIPCGRFMRKTHIDEIPQFINVLQGEMSFIGPRPERPEFVAKLKQQIVDYEKRLEVKPGITGLAQVWHRYDETLRDVRKKIKYDVLYIKRLCLWTDLMIFLRTVRVVLTGEGAR